MKHGESKLQRACIKYFDYEYPKYRQLLFAIPNGGARGKIEAGILKAEGVRAGVSDIFLAIASVYTKTVQGVSYHTVDYGLFIEFKFGKGKQTDSQKAFQKAVEEQGYRYEVISDFDSFKNLIEEYLK